jgi:endonuclease YncB( thermonuclease family)
MLPVGLKVTFASHSLDKYGRPLGTITLPDGQDFGQAMLDSGHAVPMKG